MARTLAVLATFAATLAPTAAAAAPVATVASIQSVDYRVVLTAQRTSGGAAPSASVTVAAYVRRGRAWRRVLDRRLPDTYFWRTVTAPHAICRLALSSGPAAPSVTVSLLETPSIGCATARTLRLPSS